MSLDSRLHMPVDGATLVALSTGVLAFGLYALTAAPGYTWAFEGADGGELLAAAITNGVPHPPGYPQYMLLLQVVLQMGAWLWPGAEPARLGNLWSGMCAAAAAGLTSWTIARLINRQDATAPLWLLYGAAVAGGLGFAATPLLWSQAIITEVYALHAFWSAALGMSIFVPTLGTLPRILILAGGLSHHPTFALLVPAALVAWQQQFRAATREISTARTTFVRIGLICLGGMVLALAIHLRTPWVAGWWNPPPTPPPILWGYPDQWSGWWWVMSGTPYQSFVFGVPVGQWPLRMWSSLGLLVSQYTVAGALLGLWGFSRASVVAHMLTFSPHPKAVTALWTLPAFFYAITYNTTDSYIYLLPLVWLLGVWGAVGLFQLGQRMAQALPAMHISYIRPLLWFLACGTIVVGLAGSRFSTHDLRHDAEAMDYLTDVAEIATPDSLIVSTTDMHTFALWYGAWGNRQLTKAAPGVILLNRELYPHKWYQRLLQIRYPQLEGVGAPLNEFLEQAARTRIVWLTEPLMESPESGLEGASEPRGPLWRYRPGHSSFP